MMTLSAGQATFSALNPLTLGTRYLIAMATSYDPVVSSSFTVLEQSAPYKAEVAGSTTFNAAVSQTFTVTLYNSADLPYTTAVSITMNLYGTDNTASITGITTATSSTVGQASFPLSIDRTGTFYLYPTIAGSTLMTKALSVTVTGTTTPTSVKVSNPGTIGIGKLFSVTVTLYNVLSSTSVSVTLSLSPGSLSGTVSSSVTAASNAQTIIFSNIWISPSSSAGTFTITATAGSVTGTASFTGKITSEIYLSLPSEPYFLKSVGTYTYSVKLSTVPLDTVNIAIASGTTSIITVSPSTLSFTTSNYATAQNVVLTVISGGVGSSLSTDVSITHTATSTNDATYANGKAVFYGCDRVSSSSGTLTVTVLNTDTTPGTLILGGSFYVVETVSNTFTIKLSKAPTANVDLTVASTSTSVTLSPTSLTFTTGNYNTAQTVSVSAVSGTTGTSSTLTIAIQYSFSSTDTSFANAIASETPFVVVSKSSALTGIVQSQIPVTGEKTYVDYTINLKTTPSSAVTITLTPSSSEITVSPNSFSLSSTSTQTVRVTHNPTSYPTSMTRTYTISHAATSSDSSYDATSLYSIAKDLTVYVVNTCSYGTYYDSSTYTCINCPLDHKCDSPISKDLCSSGEYSPSGQFTCLPCPPGYECNPGSTGKVACANGYYSLGSASSCIICPAGTACSLTTDPLTALPVPSSPPAECPLGTRSNAGSISCTLLASSEVGFPDATATNCLLGTIPSPFRTHCENCPAGHYCDDNTQRKILPCPTGTYSGGGLSACVDCPANVACSRYDIAGTCPEGYYSDLGMSSCVECPIGYYCTGGGKLGCAGSVKIGLSSCPTAEKCPAQHYCVLGLPPIPCPPGYIAEAGDGTCTKCDLGTYQNANDCTDCLAGYFCPTPVSPPIPCPIGTYSYANAEKCTECTAGFTCGIGSDVPDQFPCPAGFSCDLVIDSTDFKARWPKPCPKGTYSITGNTACINCVAGYYCPGAVSDYHKFLCPQGHYCPTSSSKPTACIAGTYNAKYGSISDADCLACTAGYFSYTGFDRCDPCPPGYYCTDGTTKTACDDGTYYFGVRATSDTFCKPCPAGYYCKSLYYGTIIPQACPINTYRLTTGAESSSECEDCDDGYWCPLPATSHLGRRLPCPAGKYCTAGSSPQSCPAGKYSDSTSATNDLTCLDCPAGYLCPSTGTNSQTKPKIPCTPGYYCPAGSSIATECPVGTYSNKDYLTDSSECTDCPAGYFCPLASTYPFLCPMGKYCARKVGVATNCPAGYYNPYQGIGNVKDCIICPKGHKCSAGSEVPTRCPQARYIGSLGQSACSECPAGYYCPAEGWIDPRPCNKGYYSSINAASCTICPAGHYCPEEATTATVQIANLCPAGLYCPEGTDHYPTNLYDRCSAGHYCIEGTDVETPCDIGTLRRIPGASEESDCIEVEPGYYVSTTGAYEPTGLCDPGFYCPLGSTSATQVACPAGSYRLISGATAETDCGSCPAGSTCSEGTSVPEVCPAGSYCPEGDESSPIPCPEGTYSPGTGMYQESDCIDCPAGYYCGTAGITAVSGTCEQGYLCVGKAIDQFGRLISTDSVYLCPNTGYCPQGTPRVIPCPVGQFMSSTGQSTSDNCEPCTSGHYCAGAGNSPTGECDAGFYCDGGASTSKQHIAPIGTYTSAGASSPTDCDPGTYNPAQGQSSCLTCPAGFYCPNSKMSDPLVCNPGKYCPSGRSSEISCDLGTYNPSYGMKESTHCIPCKSGYYCGSTGLTSPTGLCDAGYWCLTEAQSASPSTTVSEKYGPCTAGNYCEQGSSAPRPCPPGTYNPSTSSISSSACITCTSGKYCEGFGNSAVTGSCSAGYYCPSGAKIPNPLVTICPAGSYCTEGSTTHTQCAAGKYQENKGQSTCKDCPAGYYCPLGTTDFSSNICPKGYYCPLGTVSQYANPCGTGTYNPITGAQDSTYCLDCDPGKYCSGSGLEAVSGTCTGGYICIKKATTSTPTDGTTGSRCSSGYYCPSGGNVMIECSAGSYCAAQGLTGVTNPCAAGYYCIKKATTSTPTDGTTGGLCRAGYYCPSGSAAEYACPAGTYNSLTGKSLSSDCTDCPAGKYCLGTALTTYSGSCTAGYYCPLKSVTSKAKGCTKGYKCPLGASSMTACPGGEYQPYNLQSTCLECPAGYYCDPTSLGGGGVVTPIICPVGYYCPSGTTSYTSYPCLAGYYNPATGRTQSSDCLICPPGSYCASSGSDTISGECQAGYYCDAGSSRNDQHDCADGYYCPAGSSIKIPCPAGKYCTGINLATYSGPCTAGYYCELQATTATPTTSAQGGGVCSKGHYCPEGSFMQTPCPIGTYNPETGKVSDADCLPCTAGKYCYELGAEAVSGDCEAGFFCVEGTKTSTPDDGICPQGSYCPTGSASAILCPAGKYGPSIGLAVCVVCDKGFTCAGEDALPVICQIGYYCPEGSSIGTPCATGTYNQFEGQSECLDCPIGFYCDDGDNSQDLPISAFLTCPAGYYCPEGEIHSCPDGTYSEILGLQRIENCKPCPLGKYCTGKTTATVGCTGNYCLGAEIKDDCNAGYYCVSGNIVPSPPTSYTDSKVGLLCPTGYYCVKGVTQLDACPYGKFSISGQDEESDCSDCTEGYYCIPGDPDPYLCPVGAYCPIASQSPTDCPMYTYSNTEGAISSDSCLPCPAGYLCDDVSIGDLSRFPCTYGHYCIKQASEFTPCPIGSWAPIHGLGSKDECYPCPSGSYCDYDGIATHKNCEDWQWCPEGSIETADCPGGSYCHQHTEELVPCFGGYYCPGTYSAEVTPPYRCDKGYYCPPGSADQIPCPAGTVYVEKSLRILEIDSCVECPAGTYSNGEICLPCYAGFVCVKGASRPDPQTLEEDGGYPCPPGYYCPEESGVGSPCPIGYYYSDKGAVKLEDCKACANNTYTDLEGQGGCYPCGPNALAGIASTTCTCIGLNRAYMKRDATCRCIPGYTFYKAGTIPSDEDSSQDCVPTVVPICSTGYIRSHDGSCVLESDCTNACNGGEGKRNPDLGVCICYSTPSIDDVCDSECRATTPSVELDSSGMMIVNDPTYYTKETVDFQSTQGYTGKPHCFDGYNCAVKVIDLDTSTGTFTSDFQPSLITGTRRRLESTKKVINPVICLQYGDTMVFQVNSPDQYPVYFKNSLLNTNPDFDYGPFLELEQLIKDGGQDIKSFAYTFTDAGSYVFSISSNSESFIVISVMSQSKACTEPYLRERTSGTLSKVGVYQNTDINLDSNWKNFVILVSAFILFVIVVSIVNIFKRRNLKRMMQKNMEAYRQMLTKNASLIKLKNEGQIGIFGESGGSGSEGLQNPTAINPQIFEEIYKKLNDISTLLKDRAHLQRNMEKDYIVTVTKSLKEMKDVIHNILNPQFNNDPMGGGAGGVGGDKANSGGPFGGVGLGGKGFGFGEGANVGLNFNPSSEPETQKLIDKIVKDPVLHEKEKQELLDELSNNFASLEAQLAEDRVQAANTLKNRIDQRNRARRELMLKKQKLEEQERNLREEMQREVKDSDQIGQQCEKDYEKDKRRAREKVFGNTAKNMRKDLLEKIRKNPDQEEKLLAQYEAEMNNLEKALDDEKGQQHRELMKRIEQRKNDRKRQAQQSAEKVINEHQGVASELERINKQIDLAIKIENETQVEVALPKTVDLSEGDERNIDRKFKEMQKNSEIQHDTKQSQLEKQKQKLANSLSAATSANERDNILEEMHRIEEALQDAMSGRESDQKRILAERLKERRRLRRERQEKNVEAVPEFSAKTVNLASDDKLKKLQEIVNNLTENEKIATIKQMLADKHDQELIELQSKQQKRAALLHANLLREALDNKTEATRLAPEYLNTLKEDTQKQAISSILLEGEKEAQNDFQKQWKEHQRKCNDELLKLLDVQMIEVNETLRRLGIDSTISPEAQQLDLEFRARQAEMEREAHERLIALEKQRDELSKMAKEKQEELEKQLEAHKKQVEVEKAKRALEIKQRKELEEKVRKGEMTQKQMEELISKHQKELAALENIIEAEKKRQMDILKKKLEEKKNRKIKALQVPDDLKHMDIETAQLLKGFRNMRHQEAQFDEDILAELLRRVTHIEQVIANIDQRQFTEVMNKLNVLKKDFKS